MQWPESKRPWLRMLLSQLEVCLCECVCFWLSVCVKACVHIHLCARARGCGHVCVIAWGVYECIPRVFVLHLSTASSCRGDCETMGTDITVGGRGVSRQAAGYPITSGPLLRPLPSTLPMQPDPGGGQQGSSRLLPLSLSFHHLPPSLCWQQNFLFSLFTLYSRHQL